MTLFWMLMHTYTDRSSNEIFEVIDFHISQFFLYLQWGAVQILEHQEELFKKLRVMRPGSCSVSDVYVQDMNQSRQHLYCVNRVLTFPNGIAHFYHYVQVNPFFFITLNDMKVLWNLMPYISPLAHLNQRFMWAFLIKCFLFNSL